VLDLDMSQFTSDLKQLVKFKIMYIVYLYFFHTKEKRLIGEVVKKYIITK